MKCPVCKTEIKDSQKKCPICEFEDLQMEFINKDEACMWENEIEEYRKNFIEKLVFSCDGNGFLKRNDEYDIEVSMSTQFDSVILSKEFLTVCPTTEVEPEILKHNVSNIHICIGCLSLDFMKRITDYKTMAIEYELWVGKRMESNESECITTEISSKMFYGLAERMLNSDLYEDSVQNWNLSEFGIMEVIERCDKKQLGYVKENVADILFNVTIEFEDFPKKISFSGVKTKQVGLSLYRMLFYKNEEMVDLVTSCPLFDLNDQINFGLLLGWGVVEF